MTKPPNERFELTRPRIAPEASRSARSILVTAASEAFVQDAGDGSVHFLDAEGGCVVAVVASEGELRHLQVQR
jgi:hypothetical protein